MYSMGSEGRVNDLHECITWQSFGHRRWSVKGKFKTFPENGYVAVTFIMSTYKLGFENGWFLYVFFFYFTVYN